MRFPFPVFLNNCLITVSEEVQGVDGVTYTDLYTGPALLDEKSRSRLTADRQLITSRARVVIQGTLSGTGRRYAGKVSVDGVEYRIIDSHVVRNPDGTIYSTELDLA